MSFRIAHASIDERGHITGGTPGDQTGKEVCIRTWYRKPWQYMIRCREEPMREKIARAMEQACGNPCIGYNQVQRNTLLTQARRTGYDPGKVRINCDTDCSALVTLACLYAGLPEASLVSGGNSATTQTLRRRLSATRKFDVYSEPKYLSETSYLLRGDILLKEGSHVVVALDNGGKAGKDPSPAPASKYRISSDIKSVQSWLNRYYFTGILTDGIFGNKTRTALVKSWQTEDGSLYIDGIFGTKCRKAAPNHEIKRGSRDIFVTIWQAFLVCSGYKQSSIDGIFGPKCQEATKAYQKENSLYQDGIVGKNTWSKAFGG